MRPELNRIGKPLVETTSTPIVTPKTLPVQPTPAPEKAPVREKELVPTKGRFDVAIRQLRDARARLAQRTKEDLCLILGLDTRDYDLMIEDVRQAVTRQFAQRRRKRYTKRATGEKPV